MKHVLESWILNSTFCSYFSRVFSRILVAVWLSQHFWCLYLYTDFCEGFSVRDLANEYIYTIATYHYAKIFCIQSFSDPHFHTFGLNTEIYRVNLCIQPKCRKIQTRKTTNTDTFHVVYQIRFLPRFIEWIYCSRAYSLMPYPRNLEDFEQTSWSHFLLLWT